MRSSEASKTSRIPLILPPVTVKNFVTYVRAGLPPTPIALPGAGALRAAVRPDERGELYFVATGLGDGSHKFSKTHGEHERAVAEYLGRLRHQNRGH